MYDRTDGGLKEWKAERAAFLAKQAAANPTTQGVHVVTTDTGFECGREYRRGFDHGCGCGCGRGYRYGFGHGHGYGFEHGRGHGFEHRRRRRRRRRG